MSKPSDSNQHAHLLQQAKALLQQRRAREALQALALLLSKVPSNVEALYFCSIAHQQLGELDKAEQALRAALKQAPHEAQFLYRHASLLNALNQKEKAEQALLKAVRHSKQWREPYVALCQMYVSQSRHNEAIKLLEKARKSGFVDEQLIELCSQYYVEIGQKQAATEIVQAGLGQFPQSLKLMAELTRVDYKLADESIWQKLQGLEPQSLPEPAKFCFYAVRARCLRNRKQRRAEFADLLEAHACFEKISNFHLPSAFYFNYENNLQKIASGRINTNERISGYEPIFILGVPRSGSTLLENIIHAGAIETKKGEEVSAFSTALGAMLSGNPAHADLSLSEGVEQIYSSINLLDPAIPRFTDKSLENVLFIEQLLAVFPKANIVYCERDPVTSIVSIMRNFMSQLAWAHSLDNILRYFDLCFKAIDKWRTEFPEQIHTVRYEEMINDPEACSKALFEFCEIEWTPACLDFHKNRQNISRTSSNLQIRQGVNREGLRSFPELKEYFESYLDRYSWLKF